MSNLNKIYQSHKKVIRIAMTRLEWCQYHKWDLPENENGFDEGYMVESLDGGKPNDDRHEGYITWTSKEEFDNSHMELPLAGQSTGNLAIMKYFTYKHLPPVLREVNKPFTVMAELMDQKLKDGPEKFAGLRKLLEAKDCLVRAALE